MLDNGTTSFASVAARSRGRVFVADWHPSNNASEYLLNAIRPSAIPWLRMPCHAHIFALIAGLALGVYSDDMTGMVNFTLSFNTRGAFTDFFECVEEVIADMILIINEEDAGIDARIYRMLCIRYLAFYHKQSSKAAALLALLPNGRWCIV